MNLFFAEKRFSQNLCLPFLGHIYGRRTWILTPFWFLLGGGFPPFKKKNPFSPIKRFWVAPVFFWVFFVKFSLFLGRFFQGPRFFSLWGNSLLGNPAASSANFYLFLPLFLTLNISGSFFRSNILNKQFWVFLFFIWGVFFLFQIRFGVLKLQR